MSMTFQEAVDLHQVRAEMVETKKTLKAMNDKMDKQIALLEKVVEILKEGRTDADY